MHEKAATPNDLALFFVERANAGDVDGLVALYRPDAVLRYPAGELSTGHDEIRRTYEAMLAAGPNFTLGEQKPALVNGDYALTSTRLSAGAVTAELAVREPDGTWLWVLDDPNLPG